LDLGLAKPTHDNEELSADAAALDSYLPMITNPSALRMAYGGSAFAIRVLGSLQSLGVEFSRNYPPPRERLIAHIDALRALCPLPQFFDEAATIMVAYMELMDDVDGRLGGKSAP